MLHSGFFIRGESIDYIEEAISKTLAINRNNFA